MGASGWAGWSGVKRGKWDNCNSIINKYILKKERVTICLNQMLTSYSILRLVAFEVHESNYSHGSPVVPKV